MLRELLILFVKRPLCPFILISSERVSRIFAIAEVSIQLEAVGGCGLSIPSYFSNVRRMLRGMREPS